MYDRCMDMYVKQTSRMISLSGSGASAGKGFIPFLNDVRPIFQRGGGVFSQRLGHFLREGMKPSPAQGKCDQCMIIKEGICSQ